MKWAHISFLILLALLTGCGEKPRPQQNLKVSLLHELSNPNPQRTTTSSDYKIMQAAFEGLVVPDPETTKPLPGVAERWTISPDGKIYEFFLRDNALWSDGTPVVAEDFVFAMNRALSSKLTCSNAEVFFDVRNARAFSDRKIRDFSKVGISAVNSRTLRIELEKSNPHFLTILMHPCWFPLNKAVVASTEKYGKNLYQHDVVKTDIISNGPFLFAERAPGAYIMLEKNKTYWDADNVLLEVIIFSFQSNQMSSVRRFVEEEVSIVEMQTDNKDIIGGHFKDEELIISPLPECFGLAFNMANVVFKDRNVRVALAIAIDREKLLEKIGRSTALAAYGFIPPLNGQISRKPLFEKDVALAKKLLSKAGYGDTDKFPKIKILCNSMDSEIDNGIMKQIVDDWKTSLDIDCSVEAQELDIFLEKRKKAKFDIIKASYLSAYCDPVAIISSFASSNKKNYGKWDDKTYDEIVESACNSEDHFNRNRAIKAAELYLAEFMPAIPIFFKANAYLVKKNVRGWFPNPMDMHSMKFVYFDAE